MGLAANGMVTCTLAELQAIDLGTGPDHSTVPTGGSGLQYCDGGTLISLTPAQALGNLINLELDPHASVYGSDGSSLAAIWGLDAGPNGNTVI